MALIKIHPQTYSQLRLAIVLSLALCIILHGGKYTCSFEECVNKNRTVLKHTGASMIFALDINLLYSMQIIIENNTDYINRYFAFNNIVDSTGRTI